MRKIYFPLTIVLFILISSCNQSREREGYKLFNLENNHWKSLRITNHVSEIYYTATEVPLEYYLRNSMGENQQKIDSVYALNARERIIEVQFQHEDQTDLLLEEYTQKNYEEAVKYMAFAIEKDFSIVTSSMDTIKCSGNNFERNFKIAPFKRLLLYFNNIDPNETIELVYHDHLFGNGTIQFNFKEIPIKL